MLVTKAEGQRTLEDRSNRVIDDLIENSVFLIQTNKIWKLINNYFKNYSSIKYEHYENAMFRKYRDLSEYMYWIGDILAI